MSNGKPRITATTHILPYEQLAPRDFERLCLWLVNREGYDRAEHLGASGGEQGRDIQAWQHEKRVIFQCKRVKSFGPQDALKEVNKILDLPLEKRPVELIFLITCDVGVQTREAAAQRSGEVFKCSFWASTELDEKVKCYPDIVQEFFNVDEQIAHPRDTKLGFLLKRVQTDYVEGMLRTREDEYARFTNSADLIPIDKCWAPEALAQSPEKMAAIRPLADKETDLDIPAATGILDIYEQAGSLLILGEPGSGKLILLLQLTRLLASQAEVSPDSPVPVVLNLASWANLRKPIDMWLEDELHRIPYGVPRSDCQKWLEENQLILMLDGLDEISENLRDDCVRALNQFIEAHGFLGIVVACRTQEYQVLADKLDLRRAIRIKPLSAAQVQDYFDAAGEKLAGLRQLLKEDPSLQEMANNPLMLYVMSAVYEGKPMPEQVAGSKAAWKASLIEEYVKSSLEQKGVKPFEDQKTMRWLSWLAHCLHVHNLNPFSLDQIQPGWLPSQSWSTAYIFLSRLVIGLFAGLLGSVLVGLGLRSTGYSTQAALSTGFVEGIVGGLVAGIGMGSFDCVWIILNRRKTDSASTTTFWWQAFRYIGIFLAVFFIVVLAFFLLNVFSGELGWLYAGLQLGVLFGLCAIVLFAFGTRRGFNSLTNDIQVVENLNWTGKAAWRGAVFGGLAGAFGGAVTGAFFGCGNPLVTPLCDMGYSRADIWVGIMLITTLFPAVIGFIFGGLRGTFQDEKLVSPDQGIRISLKNSLWIGTVVGCVFAFSAALVVWLVTQTLTHALTYGFYGLFVGVLTAIYYGGLFVFQHVILCFLLWWSDCFPRPWRLIEFLEYASQRRLLVKVGGAYKFLYRDLQEYLLSVRTPDRPG